MTCPLRQAGPTVAVRTPPFFSVPPALTHSGLVSRGKNASPGPRPDAKHLESTLRNPARQPPSAASNTVSWASTITLANRASPFYDLRCARRPTPRASAPSTTVAGAIGIGLRWRWAVVSQVHRSRSRTDGERVRRDRTDRAGRPSVSLASGPLRRLGALIAIVLLALAGGALALAGMGVRSVVGSTGSDAAQFAGARGVAVNEASGDVYVADTGNNRVQLLLGSGEFWGLWGWGVQDGTEVLQLCSADCRAGSAGGGSGQLSSPDGVAVNQDTQSVYVMDHENYRIQQYDAIGNFIRTWGWGVLDGSPALQICELPNTCQAGLPGSGGGQIGPTSANAQLAIARTTGNIYVADPGNNRVLVFDGTGNFLYDFGTSGSGGGQFGVNSPTRVAVDSTGDIYVVDPGNNRVQRFNDTGTFDRGFADAILTGEPSPVEVAVNLTDDHVFVAKPCTPDLCPDAPEVADERRIFEFDRSGLLVDGTHAANVGVGETGGMSFNSAIGRLYLTTGDAVFILEAIVAPTVSNVIVATPGATTAWFAASVNPQGSPTSYRFEYSADGNDWTTVGSGDISLGSGTDPVEVQAFVTGLKGDTAYRARIVATKGFGNADAISTPSSFSTDAVPPEITLGSTTATEDSGNASKRQVTLRARIKPRGQATTYQFRFGPDDTYGVGLPAIPRPIGDGDDWVVVEQTIGSLKPGTSYHYKIVASNATGDTVGDDQVVQVGPALLDNRRYEQVSPVAKNGTDVMADSARTRAASDGTAVHYTSLGAFADTQGTGVASEYIARRMSDGWVTHGVTPPQDPQAFATYLSRGLDVSYQGEFAGDLSQGVFVTTTPLFAPPSVSAVYHLYRRKDLLAPGRGSYDLLTDSEVAVSESAALRYTPFLSDASDDFTHILLSANIPLTEDTPVSPLCTAFGFCPRHLYEWVQGSGVRLVGILPASEGGGPAPSSFAGQQSMTMGTYSNSTISRDGRRIFFTVPEPEDSNAGALYMREDGERTVRINSSEKTNPDVPQPATFWAASADGSKVFFISDEELTNISGSGLYVWDADAPAGARLALVSVDAEPHDVATETASGVLGISKEGDYVYFVASNQLVAGAGPREQENSYIYVWHAGTVKLVGTLVNGHDTIFAMPDNWALARKTSRVTSTGTLVFLSQATRGLLDYDNGSCDVGGCIDVYAYQPTANQGQGRLVCASCRPDGDTPEADAEVAFRIATGGAGTSGHLHRIVSDDGARISFATKEPLLREDRNGRHDVYMYDALNGQLALISAGSGGAAYPLEMSRDGSDVFFVTREQLVGWDSDDNVDLYDARVGGGFPEPREPFEGCIDDKCQGPLGVAPERRTPGSGEARGRQQKPSENAPTFNFLPLSRAKLRRLAAGAPVRLRVNVSERGRVVVTIRGRIGGRVRGVARESERAVRGGAVALRLRLSPKVLRRLRATGTLRLVMAVRFSAAADVQWQHFTLAARAQRDAR
jgi:hypothetical protein